MKKSILFLSILLCAISLKSQIIEYWTTPVALTDSMSNNSNPVVAIYPYDDPELLMFYEKGIAPYRQIWWKKISEPMSEEQLLFDVWPEVDCRNPQILGASFLIFECNVYGNYDLLGVRFDEDGLAGDIFRLTNTESDENGLFGYLVYYLSICCWVSDGSIYTATPQLSQDTIRFTDIELIDSGNCYDPVCQEDYITWRKVENNESHIYYSEKSWSPNQWSDPAAIIDTGNNINLSISINATDFGWGGYQLCWQADDMIYFSNLSGSYISYPEIPDVEKYYEPTEFDVDWITDYILGFYSFAGETENQRDIYIVDQVASNYVLNITNDPYVDKNPRFFAGRGQWNYKEVLNIWQTEINGHDVLYSSKARYNLVIGNIEKNKKSLLNISPNPVSGNQSIIIHSLENVLIKSLQVFSCSGNIVLKKTFNSQSFRYEIDLDNALPGIYFIKIQTSQGETVRKIIKNN